MAAKKKAAKRATKRPAKKAAPRKVSAIPKGYTSVTPGLVFKDARPALAWYGTVFGAKVTTRLDLPDGRIMHAEVKIGDALVMLGDEAPKMGLPSAETLGGSSGALMLYVKDCDAVYARAIAGGARALMPLADMFWGDRYGQIVDPFGYRWAIATHVKDLTPRQMKAAAEAAMVERLEHGGPPSDTGDLTGPPA